MRILIVEDKQSKFLEIKNLIISSGINNYQIDFAQDSNTALNKFETKKYDLLILDVCIPTDYMSEQPSIQSGFDFLYQLNTEGNLFKPGLIIGLTAETTQIEEIKSYFQNEAWSLIEYDSLTNNWKDELLKFIKYFKVSNERVYCDAFICCALDSEAKAVLNLLKDVTSLKINGLPYLLKQGLYTFNEKTYRVVVGTQSKMGSVVTSIFLVNCLNRIVPRSLGMSGILAGVKDELNYGDVVLAEQAWDYNSGKFVETKEGDMKFLPDPDPIHVYKESSDTLKAYIDSTETQMYLQSLYQNWPANKPDTNLKAKAGFVASGSAVINSQSTLDWIKQQKRKYIGLEMEIFGFYKAFQSSGLDIPCLAVKSVADFGDGTKNDLYHSYASYTSASILLNFLCIRISKN